MLSISPEQPERFASRTLAFLPSSLSDPPSVSEALEQVEDSLDVLEWAVLPVEQGALDVWRASVTVMWPRVCELEKPDAGPCEYIIWLQRKPPFGVWHFEKRGLNLAEQHVTETSRWVIGVGTQIGEDPLFEYHRLLKVLLALAPEAPIWLDASACLLWPADVLRATALSDLPPHPRMMFGIHRIFDLKTIGGPSWLHTHGLLRCGGIEYELLHVPADLVPQGFELLEVIATQAIANGPGAPGVPFSPGEGIVLEWRHWPDVVGQFPHHIGTRPVDRDINPHHLPSGVILEKRAGLLFSRYVLPHDTLRHINAKTIYYRSDKENDRLRLTAQQRLPLFRKVFQQYERSEDWRFLVQCAFPLSAENTDEAESFEHLWFLCSALNDTHLLGELMNQPLATSDMKPGTRSWIELNRITNWQAHSPKGLFDPDTITRPVEDDRT